MAEIGDYFGALDPDRMTDGGMFAWAGIITVVSLVASFFVAIWWQRRKDKRKQGAA